MTNNKKYSRWLPFVEMFTKANALGQQISNSRPEQQAESPASSLNQQNHGPKVLLCSPHPDDEILTGALPLRLLQENNATVINLAITLGSKKSRKLERLHELKQACLTVGFQCRLAAAPLALDQINPQARTRPAWAEKIKIMADILNNIQPDIIVLPHANDNHPTHQGTHLLVLDALATYSKIKSSKTILIETEFWQPIQNPNLLVGVKNEDLALLLTALSQHQGEISRNPYHLSQPARMIDNVRRGREVTGHRDSQADFLFGELYLASLWQAGEKTILRNPITIDTQMKLDDFICHFT